MRYRIAKYESRLPSHASSLRPRCGATGSKRSWRSESECVAHHQRTYCFSADSAGPVVLPALGYCMRLLNFCSIAMRMS